MINDTLSPLDSRYAEKIKPLLPYCGDFAFNRYRTKIEIEWLILLSELDGIGFPKKLTDGEKTGLRNIYERFNHNDYNELRQTEKTTNHDVKAVEYFVRGKLETLDLASLREWVHFACTSEDINNLSYALMLLESRNNVILPAFRKLLNRLGNLSEEFRHCPMLSRTHGQPATPTVMGKEIYNFRHRLQRQYDQMKSIAFFGKINGAVGNFNAHVAVLPQINWRDTGKSFVTKLGLKWNPATTQIEPHDNMAEYLHAGMRRNTILIGLCRDMWSYVSIGYFMQKSSKEQTGSSTMPHKINPIDFENAEGNLGLSNALATHLTEKLPISRWQRDLSDSTVLRNLGIIFGYDLIAVTSLMKGLSKIKLNQSLIKKELSEHPEILGEAVQTQLRALSIPNSYEKLKELTRGNTVDRHTLKNFIESLDIPQSIKQKLQSLTPDNYIGYASKFPPHKKLTE